MEAKEEGKHEEEAKGDKSDDADSEEEELAVEREFKVMTTNILREDCWGAFWARGRRYHMLYAS